MRHMHLKLNIIALCLALVLLLPLLPLRVEAASQESGTAYPVQSEQYCAQFSSSIWSCKGGVLKMNNTQGVVFRIEEKGAALCAGLIPHDAKTVNNALQLVLENRSSCTELALEYTWRDVSGKQQSGSVSLQIEPQSEKSVYYVYFDEVDRAEYVELVFEGVKNGEITLYSAGRASYYRRLTQTHGAITSGIYDPTTQTITVQGSIRTDSVVDFSGGSILLYQLLPFETLQQLMERDPTPLHSMNMSNRFTFTVDAPTFEQQNARYAVAIRDKSGNVVPIAEPVAAVHRAVVQGESGGTQPLQQFKGIYAADAATAQDMYAGSAIVDVYLNRLFAATAEPGAEVYAFDGVRYSFDRRYLDTLFEQTNPLLATGVAVTLRVLIEPDARGYALPFTEGAQESTGTPRYLGIRLRTLEEQRAYGAALSYLFSKYAESSAGVPSGIIPGTGIDVYDNYSIGSLSRSEYLQNAALLLVETKNVISEYAPNIRVYLSVTDRELSDSESPDACPAPLLLEGVCGILKDLGCKDSFVTLMLESSSAPFGLSEEILQNGVTGVQAAMYYDKTTNASQNIPTVEILLSGVSGYDCIANAGVVVWTPPADCSGLALSLSYVYLYHVYFGSRVIDGFVLCVPQGSEAQALLKPLVSGIDTNASDSLTAFALPYFGLTKWSVLSGKSPQSRTVYECSLEPLDRAQYAGRYEYWNFPSAIGTRGWSAGFDCLSLSMDGGSRFGRVLLAELPGDGGGSLAYSFSVPEYFSVCDAISTTLAVTDKNGNPVTAKITLTLFGDNFRLDGSAIVQSGEMETLAITNRLLKNTGGCRSILLTVEPVLAEAEPVRVHMMQFEGWSRDLGDDVLNERILQARRIDQPAVDPLLERRRRALPLLGFAALLLTSAGLFAAVKLGKKRRQ